MATYTVKAGSTGGTYKAGDTVNFQGGEYTYFVLRGNGTKDNPIQLNFPEECVFKNGFNVVDSGGFIWNCKGKLHVDCSGVPFSFAGKCHDIEIYESVIENCYSAVWFKTEVEDANFSNWNYYKKNADGTVSPNFVMDGLKIANMKIAKAIFEGLYLGTTNQDASRYLIIDGVKYKISGPPIANIQLEGIELLSSGRTGIQCSGVLGAGSYIRNCTVKNSGTRKELYQGANFRIGGNSNDGFEISGNTFDTSWMSNIHSQGGGKIILKNNIVKNSCIGTDPMAAVWLDSNEKSPATFIIEGNQIDDSNNGVSVVIYGSKKSVSSESTFVNNHIEGEFQNFSGVEFKTEETTIPVPPVDTTPVPPSEPSRVPIKSVILHADKTALVTREDGTTETVKGVVEVLQQLVSGKVRWAYRTTFQQTVQ